MRARKNILALVQILRKKFVDLSLVRVHAMILSNKFDRSREVLCYVLIFMSFLEYEIYQ